MLDSRKPIVTINLTPLVDVSLVLVVIFMATAPMFLQSGIIVTAGEKKVRSQTKPLTKKADNILIKLLGDKIWLNQHLTSEEELPRLLERMLAESRTRRVIVNPDRKVRHGKVIQIMDIAKQAGADNLVILGKSKRKNQEVKSQY